MATMKSWYYMGKESVELREVPVPEISDNDVLIQNIYSSICGSDVSAYKNGADAGYAYQTDAEFGHETVSRVVAKGANVTEFELGQRVYPYPVYATGDPAKSGAIGGFSEYIRVPDAKLNHSLYLVPDTISDRVASMIEPFTVGCQAARRANPRPGQKAVVFGCGTIGVAAAVALQWFGVEQIMICDLSEFRLGIAEKLGFTVCNTGKEDFKERAQAFFGPAYTMTGLTADIDIWIDAAGPAQIISQYLEMSKFGGTFVRVAVNKKPVTVDMLQLVFSEQSIIGSGGYTPQDVEDVLGIMASGRWDLESVITQDYPFDQFDQAIEKACDAEGSLKVAIDMLA